MSVKGLFGNVAGVEELVCVYLFVCAVWAWNKASQNTNQKKRRLQTCVGLKREMTFG